MSDLIDRIKGLRYIHVPQASRLFEEAIAEIERLRNQVEQLRSEVADAKKWAMSERGMRYDALVAADEARRALGSGESHE